MNSYDTLLFPDTNVFLEKRSPLLLFCTPLHFLQLIEPGSESGNNDEADLFLKHGLYQAHTPSPLGDNRASFSRMIKDISASKESYAAQLRALTIGSVAAQLTLKADDPKNEIVSSLLQEHRIEHTTTETELELWRARLILALAEMLDSEEGALREELSLFSEDEIAVLRSLQRENNSNERHPLDELEKIKARLEKPRRGDAEQRFEAWLRLMQNGPLDPVKLWLASTRDYADQILKRYKTTTGGSAVPLLKLALPAHILASGKYVVQQIEAFQQATTLIPQGLVADLTQIATTTPYVPGSPESLLPYGTDWAEQWEAKLDQYFPASRDGRSHITIYLLPEQSIAKLLSIPVSADAKTDQDAHGLLGILNNS